MKKYILLLTLLAGSFYNVLAAGPGPDRNGILYVDSSSKGSDFGTNWVNAMPTLSEALMYAAQNPGTVKQIWVAKGTYYPLYSADAVGGAFNTTNRYNTFLLVKGVRIYGGFKGTETDTASRDLTNPANVTTLSGDIGITGDNSDNAYHVVMALGDMDSTLISGFTISGGNANIANAVSSVNGMSVDWSKGGGLYLNTASLLIEDTRFSDNISFYGSAVAGSSDNGSRPDLILRRIVVTNNRGYSGPIYASGITIEMEDSKVISNDGGQNAGALYLTASVFNCRNCSFNDNKAAYGSVIFSNGAGRVHITGCEFLRDSATTGFLFELNLGNDSLVAENIKVNGCVSAGAGLIYGAGSFTFINTQITGNKSNYPSSVFEIRSGVCNVINSTVSGNDFSVFQDDGQGILNIQNSVIYGNNGGYAVRTGAVNIQYSTVDNVIADDVKHIMTADPLFTNAPSYNLAPFTGGDYTLQSSSPALNAGSNELYNAQADAPATDLAGNPRFKNVIDQGAYEMRFAQTISAQSDTTVVYGGSLTMPFVSSSGLAVSVSSGDTTIAAVYPVTADSSVWKINTKKAGTVIITVSQSGNDYYLSALADTFTLTVNRAALTITANDTARCYNTGNPLFTCSYAGWVNNETVAVLSATPSVTTTATAQSVAGNYDINPAGAAADNYVISYKKGTLTINPPPVSILAASGSTSVCNGDPATLEASGSYIFQWLLNGNEVNGGTAGVFQAVTPGMYTVSATDENNCTAMAAGSITITPGKLPGIQLPAVTVTAAAPSALQARNISGAAYEWMPATGLSNPSLISPVATLSQNQLYEIQMTLPDGCIITDTLKVSVFITNEMLVPNVFTPNGDGQNDVLLINLQGIKQLHKFSIFNRWGKKLFETSDPAQGWDGRYNGELQPLATYMWTAEGVGPSGNTIHNQGSVTLLR